MKKILVSMSLLAVALVTPAFAGKHKSKKNTRKPASSASVHVASAQYALDLFRKIGEDKSANVFFSPHSVQTALAMTSLGAKGDTLKGMMKALQLGQGAHKEFEALQETMHVEQNTVSIANKIWPIKSAKLGEAFLEGVKAHYGSEVEALDYVGDAEASRETINTWVEKETNDKIKDLLPEGSINTSTRLVLTNAVYFKGTWAAKFEENKTKNGDFTLPSRAKTSVKMMNRKGEYPYTEGDGYTALALPYLGDELYMLAVLPDKNFSLAELEASLSGNKLAEIVRSLYENTVIVSFPKFKQTFGSVSLKKVLVDMGMGKAFSSSADFSAMIPGMKLSISDVFHKAFVDVNEEGTEAAAATGVVMLERSIRFDPSFNADRPFLYFIMHKTTGRILFMGRMANPNGG